MYRRASSRPCLIRLGDLCTLNQMSSRLAQKLQADTWLPAPALGTKQIDGLQILRAFAALEVTWVHIEQDLVSVGLHTFPGLGVFGVDVFFVLSGFVMATILSRPKQASGMIAAWQFLKRRLLRIYPMLWIVIPFYLGFSVAHGFRSLNVLPTVLLLPRLSFPLMQGIIDQIWTLTFEMVFYLALFVALLFTRRAALVIAVLLPLLAISSFWINIVHPWMVYLFNPIILEFVCGIYLCLLAGKVTVPKRAGVSLLVFGLFAAIALRFTDHTAASGFQMILANMNVMQRVFTWGVAAFAVVTGMVIWNPAINSYAGRLVVLVGNASYSLYLLGPLVSRLMARFFSHTALYPTVKSGLTGTAAMQGLLTGLTCLVSVAAYVLVERPLIQYVQARYARQRSPTAS